MRTHAHDAGTTPGRVGLLGTSSGVTWPARGPAANDERYAGPALGASPSSGRLRRARLAGQRSAARYQMVVDRPIPGCGMPPRVLADEAQMAEGSPFDIVRRGDAQRLPSLLILQGTSDDNLTRHAAAVRRGLRERGGKVELEIFEGQPHSFISRDPAAAAAQAAPSAYGLYHSRSNR